MTEKKGVSRSAYSTTTTTTRSSMYDQTGAEEWCGKGKTTQTAGSTRAGGSVEGEKRTTTHRKPGSVSTTGSDERPKRHRRRLSGEEFDFAGGVGGGVARRTSTAGRGVGEGRGGRGVGADDPFAGADPAAAADEGLECLGVGGVAAVVGGPVEGVEPAVAGVVALEFVGVVDGAVGAEGDGVDEPGRYPLPVVGEAVVDDVGGVVRRAAVALEEVGQLGPRRLEGRSPQQGLPGPDARAAEGRRVALVLPHEVQHHARFLRGVRRIRLRQVLPRQQRPHRRRHLPHSLLRQLPQRRRRQRRLRDRLRRRVSCVVEDSFVCCCLDPSSRSSTSVVGSATVVMSAVVVEALGGRIVRGGRGRDVAIGEA
mmetsp:Transcript_19013/g.58603  ORF Transcript_19013/g.58603 Transcript_19013/m.58603 type:complete len:368 (-) Transcript_19013:1069-2172(-)